MGDLISAARSGSRTATITYSFGRCSLARNRDLWDDQLQQYVCGYNPDGPSDDTLLVARVTGERDEPLVSIVNYACHPTTLAWQNTLISPDFPGAMREVVERETGAPCLFLQGASGDLGPKEGFVGDLEVADRNGRQLGYAALSALCDLPAPNRRFQYTGPRESGATLGTWSWTRFTGDDERRSSRWKLRRWTVDLPCRRMPHTREQVESELERCRAGEERARAAGDEARAGDFRALAEQQGRRLQRLKFLPAGATMPYSIWLWSIGDAFWVAVEGGTLPNAATVVAGAFSRSADPGGFPGQRRPDELPDPGRGLRNGPLSRHHRRSGQGLPGNRHRRGRKPDRRVADGPDRSGGL